MFSLSVMEWGGHESGEIASGMAVRLLTEIIFQKLYLPMLVPENHSGLPPIQEVLEDAIKEINHFVFKKLPEAGTT